MKIEDNDVSEKMINKPVSENETSEHDMFIENQESKQKFKFETMGGDASLLHLAS